MDTIRVFKKLNQNATGAGQRVIALPVGESARDVHQVVCPCYLKATLPAQQKPWNQEGVVLYLYKIKHNENLPIPLIQCFKAD